MSLPTDTAYIGFYHWETVFSLSKRNFAYDAGGRERRQIFSKDIYEMKHTLFVGHYGTGKTTVAVNYALFLRKNSGKPVYLIDCDIVNPYFRSADSEDILEKNGIILIKPVFANTNLDVPALPATVQNVFAADCLAVWDVGGDDAGAVALGRYSAKISEQGYDMLAVVNFYRPITMTAEAAAEVLEQIQAASRLSLTGIINNSNLGEETTADDISATFGPADELSGKLNIPVRAATSFIDAENCIKTENYTKKYF